MEAEFPVIVYTYAFNATLDIPTKDCNATYTLLGFNDTLVSSLCRADASQFNFQDPL